MKILIALNNNDEENSKLSEHFGHCPYFATYDTKDKKINIKKNIIDHTLTNQTPVEQTLDQFKIDAVFTLGIGQRAIDLFCKRNIKLYTGKYTILKEVIENIEDLEEITSGCNH